MAPVSFPRRSVARAALFGLAATVALSACGDDPKGTIEPLGAGASTSAAPTTAATTSPTTDPDTTTPAAAQTSTKKPAPPKTSDSNASPASDKLLNGTRKVAIVPVPTFESAVGLDGTGNLVITDGDPEVGLFVVNPVRGGYLIRAGEANAAGKYPCLRIKTNGSNSLTVNSATCKASDVEQVFTIDKVKGGSYAISNRSAYLQETSSGLIAEELGDSELQTTFKLVDNGKATLAPLS
jgi:hypothetical protein